MLGLVWFYFCITLSKSSSLQMLCNFHNGLDLHQFTYLLLISGYQQIAHMTLAGRRRDKRGFGSKNQLKNIAQKVFLILSNNMTHLETGLQLVCFSFRFSHFLFCCTSGMNSSVRAWQSCASSLLKPIPW